MSAGGAVRILGIAGSLRRGSFNAATLRAAQELAPTGMTIDGFDIAPTRCTTRMFASKDSRHRSRTSARALRRPTDC
jgi:NAD(P)H-dependent FMN reductase